jgi:hypothetical protein
MLTTIEWCRIRSSIAAVSTLSPAKELSQLPKVRFEVRIIEARYLKPEVHSLMTVDRPLIRAGDLERVVLLVGQPMSELKGTLVERYLKYCETATFQSSKSLSPPFPSARPSQRGSLGTMSPS